MREYSPLSYSLGQGRGSAAVKINECEYKSPRLKSIQDAGTELQLADVESIGHTADAPFLGDAIKFARLASLMHRPRIILRKQDS